MARMRRHRAAVSGFLNVRKPAGVTSHHCVAVMRKIFNTTEVGHAGTLDPMATGVLVLALGRATKFLQYLASDKEYRGTIRFGLTTSTDDITGDVLMKRPAPWLTEQTIRARLQSFVGTIDQVPPRVSALKRDGKRLYELARLNKEFDVKPRQVTIHGIDMLQFMHGDFPETSIRVACGAGTYIRSIARECGESLELPRDILDEEGDSVGKDAYHYAGGTLVSLERTRSGAFGIAQSLEFDEIRARTEAGQSPLCPIEDGVRHLPAVTLSSRSTDHWLRGGIVYVEAGQVQPGTAFLADEGMPSTLPSSVVDPLEPLNLVDAMVVRVYDEAEPTRFIGTSHVEQAELNGGFILRKRTFITP